MIFRNLAEAKVWVDHIRDNYPENTWEIVMTSGGYDPIHPGHVSYLINAHPFIKQRHIAVVNGDWFLTQKKGRPFMPLMDRCKVVQGIQGVDHVLAYEAEDMTVCEVIEKLKPDTFCKGGDRTGIENIPEWSACEKARTRIRTNVGDGKSWSSSHYLDDMEDDIILQVAEWMSLQKHQGGYIGRRLAEAVMRKDWKDLK